MNTTIDALKRQKAGIIQRLWAFNRRFIYREPTAMELATFESDKRLVMAINAALERQVAPRALTGADIQEQLSSILREEREAMRRTRPRGR